MLSGRKKGRPGRQAGRTSRETDRPGRYAKSAFRTRGHVSGKKQTFAKRQAGCRKTYIYAGYTGRMKLNRPVDISHARSLGKGRWTERQA
jgi:hypothetical protein